MLRAERKNEKRLSTETEIRNICTEKHAHPITYVKCEMLNNRFNLSSIIINWKINQSIEYTTNNGTMS